MLYNSGVERVRDKHIWRAVLYFADTLSLDLARRKFPHRFHFLLRPKPWLKHLQIADFHWFTTGTDITPSDHQSSIHSLQRSSFGSNLSQALEILSDAGYEEVVIIGSDCPELEETDIVEAFFKLKDHRLVLGPDHRGGVYLIGLRLEDRSLLRNIQWQCDQDFAELKGSLSASEVFILAEKLDIDSIADLQLLRKTRTQWRAQVESLLATLNLDLNLDPLGGPNLTTNWYYSLWRRPPPPLD